MDQATQDALIAAIAAHNWVVTATILLVFLVPVVLHALGKDVPLVSKLLPVVGDLVQKLLASKPAAKPTEPQGVAGVVELKVAPPAPDAPKNGPQP